MSNHSDPQSLSDLKALMAELASTAPEPLPYTGPEAEVVPLPHKGPDAEARPLAEPIDLRQHYESPAPEAPGAQVIQMPRSIEGEENRPFIGVLGEAASKLEEPNIFAHDCGALNQALGWLLPINFERFLAQLDEAILTDGISRQERQQLQLRRKAAKGFRKVIDECRGYAKEKQAKAQQKPN